MKDFFDRFGDAPLCNNNPDRALHIGDFVFPLCYRCMMITIGVILGLIIIMLIIEKYHIIWKIKYSIIGFLICLPTFFDGVIQTFTEYESKNYIRITTGFLCGLGLSILIIGFINFLQTKFEKRHLT